MTIRSTEGVRERLEAEREQLLGQIEAMPIDNQDQENDAGVSQHTADDATDLFLRDRNMALRRNADDIIGQIDAAIARIDHGTYGLCERCGKPINPERLEAIPYAARCITCQSLVEQEHRA